MYIGLPGDDIKLGCKKKQPFSRGAAFPNNLTTLPFSRRVITLFTNENNDAKLKNYIQ